MKKTIFGLIVLHLFFVTLTAQTISFNLSAYSNYLRNHENLSTQELLSQYDAGKFAQRISSLSANILYLDSLRLKFKITGFENDLLSRNGFIVTERISDTDFFNVYQKIWQNDLPVFVSTDVVLNAFHKSYDLILKGTEITYLIPKIDEFLGLLHSKLSELESKYSKYPELTVMLKDADVYLTVPRKLINPSAKPYYPDNNPVVDDYLGKIEGLNAVEMPVFSTYNRSVDFSQFKPRGHYTDSRFPQLAKYFKSMIWLGRIELYLIPPSSDGIAPSKEDIRRQIIDSYLISELVNLANLSAMYDEIERTIASFVGEQDYVTLPQFNLVKNVVGVTAANHLLDTLIVNKFQDTLALKPFAGQKILSQLLMSDPMNPEQVKPASSFLLFGQRFVIDSYVTGSVVYDRIKYNNTKISRMLPSTLDILFSLGNSAAAQILTPEIDKFKYSQNLSALRYLIDSYQQDFWNSSIYNLWLSSLRTLNPPFERSKMPQFMQTAAYWQQKMNTQLASWAELRHDNILYAKQSYTAMNTCSFPYGYVEPIPDFYSSMKNMALKAAEKFNSLSINLTNEKNYLNGFAAVMDTLGTIAKKELDKIELLDIEKKFIKSMIYSTPMCGVDWNGWYVRKLLYNNPAIGTASKDYVVADYHTSPTDEAGSMVGWVKHSGTGPANLCVVVADLPNTGSVAFAGAVSSYYEYTTTNFKRLTDEEWNQTYLGNSFRPDWVNAYLADNKGGTRGTGAMLITGIEGQKQESAAVPEDKIVIQNYPNPFNPETMISFNIPASLSNSFVELVIYNINGEIIKKLISKELQSGNYLTRWDGTNGTNVRAASGVYFYSLKIGNKQAAGKMNLLK